MRSSLATEVASWSKMYRDQKTTLSIITLPSGERYLDLRDFNTSKKAYGRGVLLALDDIGEAMLEAALNSTEDTPVPPPNLGLGHLCTFPRSAAAEIRVELIQVEGSPAVEFTVCNPYTGETGGAVWTPLTDRTLRMIRGIQHTLSQRADAASAKPERATTDFFDEGNS